MFTTHARISPLDRAATINRALDQALTAAWSAERPWTPAIDIIETNDAYMVHAELPGVKPSEIDMNFEKSVLTLRGVKRSPFDADRPAEMRVYAAERWAGSFERSIRLPDFVDGSRITADLDNGVLTVSIPKAETAQPRQIEINANGRRTAGSRNDGRQNEMTQGEVK